MQCPTCIGETCQDCNDANCGDAQQNKIAQRILCTKIGVDRAKKCEGKYDVYSEKTHALQRGRVDLLQEGVALHMANSLGATGFSSFFETSAFALLTFGRLWGIIWP